MKIGNRTLELSGDNSTTFINGKIIISQSGIRVRNNGSLGNAGTVVNVERNATLEIATSNFTPIAAVTQLPGSIERWSAENARGTGTYNLPAGVNLQLNTNVLSNMTIGLNGGTIEGFLYIDHPASAVVRTIGSGATVNLLQDSFVGQNILQGFGYDAGRQPTVAQPFGDNITGATLRIEGNVTGAFNLTKTGLDTVVLAGSANSYRNTTVDAGVLRIGTANGLPSAGVLTTRYAGIFDLYGNNQTVAGLGSATGGPNPGAVSVGSSGRILNSAPTDNILTVNNTTNYTYNGTIEENVALTKSGTGTLTLGGASTYRGDTTIAGGTLALTGTISGTPSIKVQTGATFDVSGVAGGYSLGAAQVLEGTGTVAGAASVDGTVSPGIAGPGTLTMTGLADFNNGSTFAIEITSPTQFDKLVANGVTLDGTVNLAINLGYVPGAAPTSFLILDNTSASL
jgi:autotransporter-associated beta strand protein